MKNGVDYTPQMNTTTAIITDLTMAGQAQTYEASEYGKQPFISVKSTIKKMFPDFSDSSIKKVRRQVVAGYNFIVTFMNSNSTDLY